MLRFTALSALLLSLSCASPVAGKAPVIGARGAGDALLPDLGNGGYDLEHGRLDLEVDPLQRTYSGRVTWSVLPAEPLAEFSLDCSGLTCSAVVLDGEPVPFRQEEGKLVVTDPSPGEDPFELLVEFDGWPRPVPTVAAPTVPGVGPFEGPESLYVLSEPCGASALFPCNDHPSEKATYELRVTVSPGLEVAAGGRERPARTRDDGRRTFVFDHEAPVASYLVSFAVDRFEVLRGEVGGVRLRTYVLESTPGEERALVERIPELFPFFVEHFGPYPFDDFGVVLGSFPEPVSLEAQTLPVFGRGTFDEGSLAHHLAHQWFGNSVSIERWRDTWLLEGFAEYAAWLWVRERLGVEAYAEVVRTRTEYARAEALGSPASPPLEELFGARVVVRGALVLHALREELGDERFFALLRSWCTRHVHGNATLQDFLALAEEVAGEPLDDFWNLWLFAERSPGA